MRVNSINSLYCPTSNKTKMYNRNLHVSMTHEKVLFQGKAQKAGMKICGTLGLIAGCMLGPLGAIAAGAIGAIGGSMLGAVDDVLNENNNSNDDANHNN